MGKGNIIRKTGLLIALLITVSALLPFAGCACDSHKENNPASKVQNTAGTNKNITEAPQSTPAQTAPGGNPENSAKKITESPLKETEPPQTDTAPDFTVKNAEGEDVRLSSFFGKPIVLNFWATWCPPCRMELPAFEEMYKTYGDKVQFLMVNIEGGGKKAENVKQFVAEGGFTFPLYLDTTTEAAAVYMISSIPQSYFIDAEGKIVSRHLKMMEAKQLENEILKLIPQN